MYKYHYCVRSYCGLFLCMVLLKVKQYRRVFVLVCFGSFLLFPVLTLLLPWFIQFVRINLDVCC